ncbi:hypothetical protein [Pseudomonas sp. dw_612]|uniref:hypothetical protein n=1 Tax=Pseudomonas sp. dw_612 TaxID=2720080 RepID=UPI001BD6A034
MRFGVILTGDRDFSVQAAPISSSRGFTTRLFPSASAREQAEMRGRKEGWAVVFSDQIFRFIDAAAVANLPV